MSQCRQDFEKTFLLILGDFRRGYKGAYLQDHVEWAWIGWCAALNQDFKQD